jgi:hypothetical protein
MGGGAVVLDPGPAVQSRSATVSDINLLGKGINIVKKRRGIESGTDQEADIEIKEIHLKARHGNNMHEGG